MNTKGVGSRAVHALWIVGLAWAAAMGPGAARGQDPEEPRSTPEAAAPAPGWSVFPLPVIFFTPETGLAGGATALFTHQADPVQRPTAGSAAAIYTQKKQTILELAVEGYAEGEAWHYGAYASYRKFPNVAYPVGNRSDVEADEAYTHVGTQLTAELDRRVAPGVYVGAGIRLAHDAFRDLEGGGPLSAGALPGSDGGTVIGPSARITLDTRDDLFQPTTGTLAWIQARTHPAFLGSDHSFASVVLDARRYTPLAGGALALRGTLAAASAQVPFRYMPALGGQNLLRGYFDGRFRDRSAVTAQIEYRRRVWWRFGVAVFAGAGQVAPGLDDARVDAFHPSGGAGLRFLLDPDQGVNLRIDYGIGEAGAGGLYITATEAF